MVVASLVFFFFKQKTAYEMRISDWSSDVCSSDLVAKIHPGSFRLDEHLRERGGIAEAEVEPLPRDRKDAVRRITDQRQQFGGDRRGVVEAERIARARLEGRQRAEETRSEEHTSELQSLMRIAYDVFCLKKTNRYIYT